MTIPTVHMRSSARIPTSSGQYRLRLYESEEDGKQHLAMIMGDLSEEDSILLRVHSECFTGDVMGSTRCDCGVQLERSMAKIASVGRGVLLYLRQEGRGIGLLDKLRAYNLQDEGYDTVDANLLLGHAPDARDYGTAAAILQDLEVKSVRLLTNNPDKINQLQQAGITITDRVPLEAPVTEENASYLRAKSLRLNHLLTLSADHDETSSSSNSATNGREA